MLGSNFHRRTLHSAGNILERLKKRKIAVYRTFVGEFATSMEMAGASISICKLDDTLKEYLDYPVRTPFLSIH